MVPNRLPWVHTASAHPRDQGLDVVGPGIGGEVQVVAHLGRRRVGIGHDRVPHRSAHQIEGVPRRSEAVGEVGGDVDQGPQALG